VPNPQMVAFCGLYCGACKRYLNEKCSGFHDNAKASWCEIRSCCLEYGYSSCAECKEFNNPSHCKNFNNFISKVFGFIFKSDRAACIDQIKKVGNTAYAEKMSELKLQSIKNRKMLLFLVGPN
jgi:hypothetical protein